MASKVEKSICLIMRPILNKIEIGSDIGESESVNKVLSLLETYISLKLRKKYGDWKFESIDGIFVSNINKTDENQFSFLGMCVLISDQSLIPLWADIKLSDSTDEFILMECKLAEQAENGILKIPYDSNLWKKKLYTLDKKSINWYYSLQL